MKFTLHVNSFDNAAMADDPEFAIIMILKTVALRVDKGERSGSAWDANGNKVGYWEFTEEN